MSQLRLEKLECLFDTIALGSGKSRSFPLLWNQKIEEVCVCVNFLPDKWLFEFCTGLSVGMQYMSKGRFKAAEHQAVVNSNCSRLSIATFMIPAPEAIIYPLKIREGKKPELEEPILFAELYRKKLSRDLEVINSLKKTAKEQKLQDWADLRLEYGYYCSSWIFVFDMSIPYTFYATSHVPFGGC